MLDSAPRPASVDPLLACLCCSGRGAVERYAPGLPFGFDDGLGATVEAPCSHCSGTGSEPCSICHDAPATSTIASRPVCDDCAPFVRRAVASTIPAPAECAEGR